MTDDVEIHDATPEEEAFLMSELAVRASKYGYRIAELEKALGALADALQDEIESSMGRELTARDLPKEWHAAQALLGRR